MKGMTILTRAFLALALFAGMAGSAGAIPPGDIRATVRIYRWGGDEDVKLVEAALARFKRRYPNVTVVVQRGRGTPPWSVYINQFMSSIVSGDTPDVVAMPIEGIATLAYRIPLVDIEEIAKNDPDSRPLLDNVDPNLLDGLRWKGKLNFFPNEWNCVVMFYNPAMFAEAGLPPPREDWTWDDMLEAAKRLTLRDADGAVRRYGLFVPGTNFALAPWFLTNDTSPLSPDWRRSNVADPRFAESLRFLYDLIHRHKVSPPFVENDLGVEAFAQGRVAMFCAGIWPTPDLEKAGIPFAVQYFPQKRKRVTVYGIGGNCILRLSRNPELAWELVKELSGVEAQLAIATSRHAVASLRSVATRPDIVNIPPNGKIFYGSAATAVPIASPPNFAAVEDIVMRHTDAYLRGRASLEATIAAMDTELQRAMGRVKW